MGAVNITTIPGTGSTIHIPVQGAGGRDELNGKTQKGYKGGSHGPQNASGSKGKPGPSKGSGRLPADKGFFGHPYATGPKTVANPSTKCSYKADSFMAAPARNMVKGSVGKAAPIAGKGQGI